MKRLSIVLATALALAGCGGAAKRSSSSVAAPSAPTTTKSGTTQATSTTTPAAASSTTSSTTTAGTSTTTPLSTPTLAAGFHLTSSAFADGGAIPSTYTCDGADISPPLSWSGVPKGTRELVLVMRDPDAPGGDFVHWALAGISPSTTGFPAGGVSGLVAPGRNSLGSLGYRGPCPPAAGRAHHYVISLSALAAPSGLGAGFSADQVHTQALGLATLTGTYARR